MTPPRVGGFRGRTPVIQHQLDDGFHSPQLKARMQEGHLAELANPTHHNIPVADTPPTYSTHTYVALLSHSLLTIWQVMLVTGSDISRGIEWCRVTVQDNDTIAVLKAKISPPSLYSRTQRVSASDLVSAPSLAAGIRHTVPPDLCVVRWLMRCLCSGFPAKSGKGLDRYKWR